MHAPIRALLWEQWRQTRLGIGLMVLLLAPMGYAAWSVEPVVVEWPFFMVAPGALFFMMLHLAWMHRRGIDFQLGFPEHLYRLPIRTSVLIAVNVGYRVVVALVLCTLWSLCLGPASSGDHWAAFFSVGGIYILLLSLALAASWTLGTKHPAWAVALTFFTPLLLWIFPGGFIVIGLAWLVWPVSALVLLGVAAAGATHHRGGSGNRPAARTSSGYAKALHFFQRESGSTLSLRWYEAHRSRMFIWVMWGCTAFIWMTLFHYVPEKPGPLGTQVGYLEITALPILVMPILAGLISINMYFSDRRDEDRQWTFNATRPLSAGQMTLARLCANAYAVVMGAVAPLFVFAALLCTALKQHPAHTDVIWSNAAPGVFLVVPALVISWSFLCCPYLVVAGLLLLCMFSSLMYLEGINSFASLYAWGLGLVPFFLLAIATLLTGSIAWERRLFDRSLIRKWAIVWGCIVFFGIAVLVAVRYMLDPFWLQPMAGQKMSPMHAFVIQGLTLSLLPLFTLFTQPLYIRWLRHR
jgi:hypothetical protein